MRAIGRSLQHVALFAPPVSMVLQLAGQLTLGQMLVMLVASVCLFFIGRLVEGYAR